MMKKTVSQRQTPLCLAQGQSKQKIIVFTSQKERKQILFPLYCANSTPFCCVTVKK